jgi:hypothetical protein
MHIITEPTKSRSGLEIEVDPDDSNIIVLRPVNDYTDEFHLFRDEIPRVIKALEEIRNGNGNNKEN